MDRPGFPAVTMAWAWRKRMWAGLVTLLFFLPLGLVLFQFGAMRLDRYEAEAAALRDLASPTPKRSAWGVLGTIRLEQGRIAESLPLLEKAAALESGSGTDTHDTLALAEANIEGARRGVAGAGYAGAEAALLRAQTLAQGLPTGKRAATWFSAGLFWQAMGDPDRARQALRTAVVLQNDDWVDEGGGLRVKSAGLAAYYQKMLAGALEH